MHKELYNLKKNGIDHVILEASSHGLAQGRLNKIDFKAGIFTNFSQDHLDYHKNMKNYFNSKMILFSNLLSKKGNIIADKEINEFPKLKNIAVKRKLNLLTIDKKSMNNIYKSTKNIPNVKITDTNHFSAFDLAKYKKVILTETSVKELEKRCS